MLGHNKSQPVTDVKYMKAMEVLLKDQENEIETSTLTATLEAKWNYEQFY